MDKITLMPAYMFDCEYCGKENFIRAIISELPDEEDDVPKPQLIDSEDGKFTAVLVRCPNPTVVCQHCQGTFEPVYFFNELFEENVDDEEDETD